MTENNSKTSGSSFSGCFCSNSHLPIKLRARGLKTFADVQKFFKTAHQTDQVALRSELGIAGLSWLRTHGVNA